MKISLFGIFIIVLVSYSLYYGVKAVTSYIKSRKYNKTKNIVDNDLKGDK